MYGREPLVYEGSRLCTAIGVSRSRTIGSRPEGAGRAGRTYPYAQYLPTMPEGRAPIGFVRTALYSWAQAGEVGGR